MNPLAALFGAGVAVRNSLFDHGVLPSRRLQQPVISVGNLSVGGSGKTPFVIALGELLTSRGIRYDVLSRGYRRKTRGVRVVEATGSAADFGDEPLLIARKLNVPVIVGESRYEAGRLAEERFDSQLHILDDGFQHRSLHRDFDIVILTLEDLADRLLPSGRLREPLSSLKRAHAIVLPESFSPDHPLLAGKLVWRARRELLLPQVTGISIAFCGIARPQQFFANLREAGLQIAAELAFRDHHRYSSGDIERLKARQRAHNADGFITTEKDAVGLGPFQDDLQPLSIAALRLVLDSAAQVVDDILATLSLEHPHSSLARIANQKPRS